MSKILISRKFKEIYNDLKNNEKNLNFEIKESSYLIYSSKNVHISDNQNNQNNIFNVENLNTDERKLYEDLQILEKAITELKNQKLNESENYERIKVYI